MIAYDFYIFVLEVQDIPYFYHLQKSKEKRLVWVVPNICNARL